MSPKSIMNRLFEPPQHQIDICRKFSAAERRGINCDTMSNALNEYSISKEFHFVDATLIRQGFLEKRSILDLIPCQLKFWVNKLKFGGRKIILLHG
jgi:hypothetical protein